MVSEGDSIRADSNDNGDLATSTTEEDQFSSGEDNYSDDNNDATLIEGDGIEEAGETSIGENNSVEPADHEGGSESGESDDEDDLPPILKYTRLNQLPSNFFSKDAISTCTFGESYFIFATHSGFIHITKPDFTTVRTFKAHRASVLSLYTDGLYFASGSMDGTIVIGSIRDEKEIVAFDFKRPIHAVILDKNYQKTRSFVSGGMSGKVTYSSRNWLGQRSDVVLEENNGPIVAIQAIDDLILWMNDKGITFYHISTRQEISVIGKPLDSPRGDLYWPRVHFPESDRILIAWGNYLWSLRITIRSGPEDASSSSRSSRILPSTSTISFRSVQTKKVEVEHVFKLDCLVSGIASYKDDMCMILTYNAPDRNKDTDRMDFNNPDLRLISSVTGITEHEEEIGLRDIENLGLNDYMLGFHHGTSNLQYFIVSAKDAVVAESIKLGDLLSWYLERQNYYEAWSISRHLVSPIKRLNYGSLHVDHLVKEDRWLEAASFLSELLFLNVDELPDSDTKSTVLTSNSTVLVTNEERNDLYVKEIVSTWVTWATIFIRANHIDLLTNIIPTSAKLSLPLSIYNSILKYWMKEDQKKFYHLIETWDTELYPIKEIQSEVEEMLESQNENQRLRRILTELYVKSYEPSKAVPHLIALQDPNIVHFLSVHHILANFVEDLPKLIGLKFEANEMATLPIEQLYLKVDTIVETLVNNIHELPPSQIIKLMAEAHMHFMNYFYLESLSTKDDLITQPFGDEQIRLYSQFNRDRLLPFLTKNNNYDIDKAVELCESNEFTEELVYLLGKIGENKKALMLIINKLDDPEKAIKFAKHQNDKEAWNILLEYSMSKPLFIQALIECADDQSNLFYDPVSILERMPANVKIEGLKNSVTKISSSNDVNLVLNQLILKIIYKQSEELSKIFKVSKLKGYEFEAKRFQSLLEKFEPVVLLGNSIEGMDLVPEQELFSEKSVSQKAYTSYSNLKDKIEHLSLLNGVTEKS